MSAVPAYLQRLWRGRLEALFEERDQRSALDWLIANHGRQRVVFVGSGFSRNATNASAKNVPLWSDVTATLAKDLRLDPSAYDPLTLADFHRKQLGANAFQERLLSLLDNDGIQPGAAHEALWSSNPEAVVTTNFLDTLLEDRTRAQPVTEDPDLARPLTAGRRHLLYLHGHRDQFSTWVVSRSDYDDLESTRPMIFARVRQLLAQFPLLVVGYSLQDPDFHLVYRHMVRCMKGRHPLGLAVLLDGGETSEAISAARGYWQDLGLKLVQLKSGASISKQFIEFFRLTEQIRTAEQLRHAFVRREPELPIQGVFRENLDVMQSALADTRLGSLLSAPSKYAALWHWVLRYSLGETNQKRDTFYEQGPLEADGAATAKPPLKPLFPDREYLSRLLRGRNEVFEELFTKLLGSQTENAFVDNVGRLLREGVDPTDVADWLYSAVDDIDLLEELDSVQQWILLIAAALSTGRVESLQLIRDRSESRYPELASALDNILGAGTPSKPFVRSTVDLLKRAADRMMDGEFKDAEKLYFKAEQEVLSCRDRDAPLLRYFCIRGLIDCMQEHLSRLPWSQQKELLPQQRELAERRAEAQDDPYVSNWLKRLKEFKHKLEHRKLEALREEAGRLGYEPRHFRFSKSARPGNLYARYLDARAMGAPISVLRGLSAPLLGNIGLEEELSLRLQLGLEDTGSWIAGLVGSGDVSRLPVPETAPLMTKALPLTVASDALLPRQLGGSPSSYTARVRAEVVTTGYHIIPEDRIADVVASIGEMEREKAFGAWLGLARVCCWKDLSGPFSQFLHQNPTAPAHSAHAATFPMHRWMLCEDFLQDGGPLLAWLAGAKEPLIAAGFELLSVLQLSGDVYVSTYCSQWLNNNEAALLEANVSPNGERLRAPAWAAAVAMLLESKQLREAHTNIVQHLIEAMQHPISVDIVLALADAEDCSELLDAQTRAREKVLEHAMSEHMEVQSSIMGLRFRPAPEVLVSALKRAGAPIQPICERLLKQVETTWTVLPSLGPIMAPKYWDSESWRKLITSLRVGGHITDCSNEWLLRRTQLLVSAICAGGETLNSVMGLDSGVDALSFLRKGVAETLFYGDGLITNHSAYALAGIAQWTPADRAEEVEGSSVALRASAVDRRINVAHGAAYSAQYLLNCGPIAEPIREAAQGAADTLAEDPTAIIRRQLEFGAAKGKRSCLKEA